MSGLAMRRKVALILLVIFILQVHAMQEERSVLDKFVPILRIVKKTAIEIFRKIEANPQSRELLRINNRQFIVPDNIDFPCNLNSSRSSEVPKTVHEVRAGDIDVIAGIGDSLTAGFGASANTIIGILSENRGKSFSVGGQETWRTALTLPNILKMYNPNLIGYSLGTSITTERDSQFNVAEGGAISGNMPYMAKVLVNRITTDPRVDVKKDWKMVTLMVGDNDFCSEMCYYKNQKYPKIILNKHKRDLLDVLRTLRANLPRTIVNVIPPLHLKLITQMKDKPPICILTHLLECPCINSYNNIKMAFNVMRKWQELDIEVSNYPEFDLDDFTVIPHYFTLELTMPRTPEGKLDYNYLSQDCFHFSEKGQSKFANDLWNSILEPFGNKSTDGTEIFSKFNCPSDEHPYIFTRRNSV